MRNAPRAHPPILQAREARGKRERGRDDADASCEPRAEGTEGAMTRKLEIIIDITLLLIIISLHTTSRGEDRGRDDVGVRSSPSASWSSSSRLTPRVEEIEGVMTWMGPSSTSSSASSRRTPRVEKIEGVMTWMGPPSTSSPASSRRTPRVEEDARAGREVDVLPCRALVWVCGLGGHERRPRSVTRSVTRCRARR